jgi:GNAT superfamily N-acetyltransferase
MPPGFVFRAATPDDAELIASAVRRGFEGYRQFAPAGWEPPNFEREVELVAANLGDPQSWCTIAEVNGGAIAGHCMFSPAATAFRSSDEPRLAHLRGLFVEPRWWGTGLARELHAMALHEAAARGWLNMRLFTPAGQQRARRFYEREGWRQIGVTFEIADGLPTVEYRRGLG